MSISNVDLTVETLQTPGGIRVLNDMLNKLARLVAGDGESLRVFNGYGSPEENVVADVGSIYLRKDGGASTSIYVKETGTDAEGWVAK